MKYWISHLYWLLIWPGQLYWPFLLYHNSFGQKPTILVKSEFPTVAVFADEQVPKPCWLENDKWPCQIHLRLYRVLCPEKHLLMDDSQVLWDSQQNSFFSEMYKNTASCIFDILAEIELCWIVERSQERTCPCVMEHGHGFFCKTCYWRIIYET